MSIPQIDNSLNFPLETNTTSINSHFMLPEQPDQQMEDCLMAESGLLPCSEFNMLGIENDLNDIFKQSLMMNTTNAHETVRGGQCDNDASHNHSISIGITTSLEMDIPSPQHFKEVWQRNQDSPYIQKQGQEYHQLYHDQSMDILLVGDSLEQKSLDKLGFSNPHQYHKLSIASTVSQSAQSDLNLSSISHQNQSLIINQSIVQALPQSSSNSHILEENLVSNSSIDQIVVQQSRKQSCTTAASNDSNNKLQKEIFFVSANSDSSLMNPKDLQKLGNNKRAKKVEKKEQQMESKFKVSQPQQSSINQSNEESSISNQDSSNSASNQSSTNSKRTKSDENTYDQFNKLTNKKQKYMKEIIQDKNGTFTYVENPQEYKKARKRMQNRESAVRSRQRKNYYQEDLELKFDKLQKLTKELSEHNTGLQAQNSLLQKQLAYFEDVFAKSQLLGYDSFCGVGIKKNELEEFKRSIINKINATFSDEETDQFENSLDFIPGQHSQKRLKQDNFAPIQNHSAGFQSGLKSLRLARTRNGQGFQNQGCMFLAIMFCMMCCSSLMISPSSTIKLVNMTQNTFAKTLIGYDGGRKLLFSKVQQEKQVKTLNSKLEDEEMQEVKIEEEQDSLEHSNLGIVKFTERLFNGEYTYLTYMIMSTTCFFFWMTPNYHKIKAMFKGAQAQKQANGSQIQNEISKKVLSVKDVKSEYSTRSKGLKNIKQ
eukprot:403333418